MKAYNIGLALAVGLSLTACSRVPGTFSTSDVDSAPAASSRSVDEQELFDFNRLSQIEAKIDESLARLEAAFDPNAPEANLDRLVQENEEINTVANNGFVSGQQIVEHKFNEKNRALINDELTGNLENTTVEDLNTDSINSNILRQKVTVNQLLDVEAASFASGSENEVSADIPTVEDTVESTERTSEPDPMDSTPEPDVEQPDEGTRESL